MITGARRRMVATSTFVCYGCILCVMTPKTAGLYPEEADIRCRYQRNSVETPISMLTPRLHYMHSTKKAVTLSPEAEITLKAVYTSALCLIVPSVC